jgi:hypothetical protein
MRARAGGKQRWATSRPSNSAPAVDAGRIGGSRPPSPFRANKKRKLTLCRFITRYAVLTFQASGPALA